MEEGRVTSESGNKRPLREATGFALLLVLCMAPGFFYSYKGSQSPWNTSRIARASFSLRENHVATFITPLSGYRSEHIGGEMVQAAFVDATAWPVESIGMLPIGSLLLAILYYSMARNVSRSRWTIVATTLFGSWFYPRLVSQFGTHTYAWTNVLFLCFLILLRLWIRRRTLILSTLIMLVYVATFLHYHATPLWMIAALVVAVMAKRGKHHDENAHSAASWALPLFCIVLYLAYDTVMYSNGLVRFATEPIDESLIQSFVSRIVAPLVGRQPHVQGAYEMAVLSPRAATQTTLMVLLLVTIPVGIWCLITFYRAVRSRDLGSLVRTKDDVFIWAIIAAAMTHTALYSLYGALSLRLIPLAFPLLLPLVTRELGLAEKLEPVLPCLTAVLAIIGLISYAPNVATDTTASETGLAARLFEAGDQLLGEPVVYASLLLNAANDDKIIDFQWLDSDEYASVVGQQPGGHEAYDYIIADMSGHPITSGSWVFLEPWTQHLAEINENTDLNKVYDSENLKVFQPRGKDLPNYQPDPGDVYTAVDRFRLDDAFRLFLATMTLVLLPGSVCVCITQQLSVLEIQDVPTRLGLAVSLSIVFVTLVGYLTNFTPLGLKWLVPLTVTVPWTVLGLFLILRRPRCRLRPAWIIHGSSIMIVAVIWTLLSTGAARVRDGRYAGFTEFFVTEESSQSRSLTVNVVSRLKESKELAIVFELDGNTVQTLGPRPLAPNALWTLRWHRPALMGERLAIELQEDGVTYHELHLSDLQD